MSQLKAKVVPLKFKEINEREEGEYYDQLAKLNEIYGDVAEFLDPAVKFTCFFSVCTFRHAVYTAIHKVCTKLEHAVH